MSFKWQTLSIASLVVGLIAACLSAQDRPEVAPAAGAGGAAPAAMLIGTYDGRAVALAYYRSDAGLARIKAVVDEARKAKAANDKNAAELERKVHRLSMRNHAQVFSNLPVSEVVQKHVGEQALREIARQAGVQAIVPAVEWRDESIQTVDVTDALVEHFRPSDKTRGYARDIRNKPPAEIWEVVSHEHASADR